MNRLQHETSPYLRQHQENPVDWYPWGAEALQRAQAEDKPILLSVGYSACHWCHVMAHESFEHEPTAQMMNDWFVNIKVDREERPDIDDIYMQAVQAMNNGGGGWPMTVFLLPDGKPFYGGTYYPLEPRYGMPPFRQLLTAIHDAYTNRREALTEQANDLTSALDRTTLKLDVPADALNLSVLEKAGTLILREVDAVYGGFGGAPKFPSPMNWEYLLRVAHHDGNYEAETALKRTLYRMARGGIYDQIGGGFHRYSVDALWLVPHFEKMLYDNAQLSRLYLHAYQKYGDPFFKQVAEDIYDYILREMTAPEGGFYSATDADSEGEEGKFFVWSLDELQDALVPLAGGDFDAVAVAVEYYGVTRAGNFEGHNILHVPNDAETVAQRLNMTPEALQDALAQIKDRLYAMRTGRVAPALDDKILTAWNGMMLASLAEGGRVLGREDYLTQAERCGEFFLETMMAEGGRLFRTYNHGIAKLNGYLEDYANLIDGFLELYQATFLTRWYEAAVKLAEFALVHFVADDGAGFFDTSDDHETLIIRPRSLYDNATPSGSTMMAKQLVRLFALTGDMRYEEHARATLRPLAPAFQQYPQAFGEGLNATDMLIRGVAEVAIVGNPTQPATKALLDVMKAYTPNAVVALARDPNAVQVVPLLRDRVLKEGQPTAYVCRQFVCMNPVIAPDALNMLLHDS